jgi:hypothetical protein
LQGPRTSPPDFRDAEATINRLRGVVSSRIVVDAGEIVEVHVMAGPERAPKQIVRDVESAIFATLGTKVDHRKISVAVVSKPRGEAAPTPTTGAGRLRFVGLNVRVGGGACDASVELERGGLRVVGDSSTRAGGGSALRSIAEATIRAVMRCFEGGPTMTVEEIAFVGLSQRQGVVVTVACHEGRETTRLLGAAFVGDDAQQAVVCAALDAVNRFSGRLRDREFVELEVGPALASS